MPALRKPHGIADQSRTARGRQKLPVAKAGSSKTLRNQELFVNYLPKYRLFPGFLAFDGLQFRGSGF
jgi:hypothetical protein